VSRLLALLLAAASWGAEWKARTFERVYEQGRLEFSLSYPKEWTLKERTTSLVWSGAKGAVFEAHWLDPDKVYDVESVCRAGMCEELGAVGGIRVAKPTPERRKAMGLGEGFLFAEAAEAKSGVNVWFTTERLSVKDFKGVLATFKEAEPSYTACGCGCCGGVEPEERCLREKGELERVRAEDRKARKNPDCAMAGCSRGVRYKYCGGAK